MKINENIKSEIYSEIHSIRSVTNLTKEEINTIIHYLWNYATIPTLLENNPEKLKKILTKIKKIKNALLTNKILREHLVELFYKQISPWL